MSFRKGSEEWLIRQWMRPPGRELPDHCPRHLSLSHFLITPAPCVQGPPSPACLLHGQVSAGGMYSGSGRRTSIQRRLHRPKRELAQETEGGRAEPGGEAQGDGAQRRERSSQPADPEAWEGQCGKEPRPGPDTCQDTGAAARGRSLHKEGESGRPEKGRDGVGLILALGPARPGQPKPTRSGQALPSGKNAKAGGAREVPRSGGVR